MSLRDAGRFQHAGRTDVWRPWLVAAFLTGLVVGLNACGAGDAARGEWAGSVDTLADGAVHVHNPATGVWDSATAWRVEEELRIGTAGGEGPELFGSINDVAVDGHGRVWVLDGQARELRVFDAAGEHVRTVGREGGGPGEFEQPVGMDWAPTGDLWVYDPQNARFAVFDTAGSYVTGYRRPLGGSYFPWRGGFGDDGRLYDLGSVPDGAFETVFIGFDVDTGAADGTLVAVDTVPLPESGDDEYLEARSENSAVRVSAPFAPTTRWALDRRGLLWFGATAPYRVYKRTRAGDTLRIIEREYEPVPVTADEIDEAIERLDWFVRQGGEVGRSDFPDVKPAWRRFFVDDTGHLWVEPVTADEEEDQGRIFDIFDPDGRYLGRLRSPFQVRRPVFRDGDLYAVTTDELDVPYVVRARVVRPADGDGT